MNDRSNFSLLAPLKLLFAKIKILFSCSKALMLIKRKSSSFAINYYSDIHKSMNKFYLINQCEYSQEH